MSNKLNLLGASIITQELFYKIPSDSMLPE